MPGTTLVEPIPATITVKVTPEDIRAGLKGEPEFCATARALQREYGGWWEVFSEYVVAHDADNIPDGAIFAASPAVWIVGHDEDPDTFAFTYDLNASRGILRTAWAFLCSDWVVIALVWGCFLVIGRLLP